MLKGRESRRQEAEAEMARKCGLSKRRAHPTASPFLTSGRCIHPRANGVRPFGPIFGNVPN